MKPLTLAALLVAVAACAELLGDVDVGPRDVGDAISLEQSAARVQPDAGALGAEPSPPLPAEPAAAAAEARVPLCQAGDFRCQGSELSYCPDGSAWALWQLCDSAALCESEPAGRCLPPECEPDETRCEGAELQRCNGELTGWVPVETCATAAHCDPSGQTCLAAPCEVGQQRCNRGQLQQCRSDQLDWDVLRECATQNLCRRTLTRCQESPDTCDGDALACDPPVCEPEQLDCNRARLRVCNRGRAGWQLLEACATPGLCEASVSDGRVSCVPAACEPEALHCTDDGTLEACNAAQTGFDAIEHCRSAALCNAAEGRCDAPVCAPGDQQCTLDGELLSCNADLTGFVAQTPPVECDGDRER